MTAGNGSYNLAKHGVHGREFCCRHISCRFCFVSLKFFRARVMGGWCFALLIERGMCQNMCDLHIPNEMLTSLDNLANGRQESFVCV